MWVDNSKKRAFLDERIPRKVFLKNLGKNKILGGGKHTPSIANNRTSIHATLYRYV